MCDTMHAICQFSAKLNNKFKRSTRLFTASHFLSFFLMLNCTGSALKNHKCSVQPLDKNGVIRLLPLLSSYNL